MVSRLKDVKRSRNGFTLIEFMLVMALGLIAMIAIVPRYQSYTATSQGREEAAKCGEFKTYIVTNYQDQADYKDLGSGYLSIAPTTFRRNTAKDKLINVWKHDVSVIESSADGGTDNAFLITETGVPQGGACVEFVKRSQGNGWNEIKVGSIVIVQSTGTSDILKACKIDTTKKHGVFKIELKSWNQMEETK